MKYVGIICEYNIFHNAHKYHIEKSKQLSGADGVICVMSPSFVQRGEPAIVDKWTRAKMALENGADLVVELPTYYALNGADVFSYGAVSVLNALGCIDYISFGCESDSIIIETAAKTLADESDEYKRILEERLLSEGYPKASAYALSRVTGIDEGALSQSNNILAIQYVRTLMEIGSNIKPVYVKRNMVDHDSDDVRGGFASASKIREMIRAGEDITNLVPEKSAQYFYTAQKEGKVVVDLSAFDTAVLSHFRRCDEKDYNSPDGLENRIIKMSRESGTIDELIEKSCTKRYTKARVSRAVWQMYLGIELEGKVEASYIRVIGATKKGREILKTAKDTASLPIITKLADFDDSDNKMLKTEITATDLYVLGYNNPKHRMARQDFYNSPIML